MDEQLASSLWTGTIVTLILFAVTVVCVVISVASIATNPFAYNAFTGQALANYKYVQNWIPQLDSVIIFLLLGANVAILYRATFLKADPLNYPIAWLMSIFIIWLSFLLSNVMVNVFQASALSTGVGWFHNSIYYFRMFPIYNAIFLGLYTVFIFTRYLRSDSNG